MSLEHDGSLKQAPGHKWNPESCRRPGSSSLKSLDKALRAVSGFEPRPTWGYFIRTRHLAHSTKVATWSRGQRGGFIQNNPKHVGGSIPRRINFRKMVVAGARWIPQRSSRAQMEPRKSPSRLSSSSLKSLDEALRAVQGFELRPTWGYFVRTRSLAHSTK